MAQSASYGAAGSRGSREAQDKRQFFFDSIPVQETLHQNLIGQLNQSLLSATDRKAAELIVGNIDDNGFLQSTPEEMTLNAGIPKEDFEKMLALIQTFYPAGVGAHDLRECLLIQLRRAGKERSLEYKVVSEHMEDLGRRRFPEIARRMGISVEDVQKVADAVGVHETTVSRAVSGKYMATPQGVFEMKYFFTSGYQTATGDSLSNISVKEAILDLVKHENGSAPLSDHEIVEILAERGIPIARRTVAKYRDELNILPSHMRRKY